MTPKKPANRAESPAEALGSVDQVDALPPEPRAFYDRVRREWSIGDGVGELSLLTAAQSLSRLRQAQELLKRDGLVTLDRFGQSKLHPATVLERESRAGLISALKLLNLDLESLEIGEDAA